MTDKAEWLAGLEVGDLVVVESSYFGTHAWLTEVARFTKTLIVTTDDYGFRRTDGISPGAGYHHPMLSEPTTERQAAIKARELRDQINAIDWKTVPLATLETVMELVAQARKAKR